MKEQGYTTLSYESPNRPFVLCSKNVINGKENIFSIYIFIAKRIFAETHSKGSSNTTCYNE